MALQHETLFDFDAAYTKVFLDIEEFFRFAKRHPDVKDEMNEYFNDEYYAKAAAAMKARIDHELKHLHSPYLD